MHKLPSPEAAPFGTEAAYNAASERMALTKIITPTGAPAETSQLLGNVAPAIMNTIVTTGVLAFMLIAMKTVVTGKAPFKKLENII